MILNVVHDILNVTHKDPITVLILLDFSKACNTNNHNILLEIMHFSGLLNEAIKLLDMQLNIKKGVPQGLAINPLLSLMISVLSLIIVLIVLWKYIQIMCN